MQDEKHRNASRSLWVFWNPGSVDIMTKWFQGSQCVPLIIQRVGFPLHLIVCKCWPPWKWPCLPSDPSLAVKNCHLPTFDLVTWKHQSGKYLRNGWVEKVWFFWERGVDQLVFWWGNGTLLIWNALNWQVNYRPFTMWKWGLKLNENKYMCMYVQVSKFSCETEEFSKLSGGR